MVLLMPLLIFTFSLVIITKHTANSLPVYMLAILIANSLPVPLLQLDDLYQGYDTRVRMVSLSNFLPITKLHQKIQLGRIWPHLQAARSFQQH